jgi:hypothetical protein
VENRAVSAGGTASRSPWLTSPAWDFFWVLNAVWLVPLAVLFFFLGRQEEYFRWVLTASLTLLVFGHVLGPIVAAWTIPELRSRMAREPGKFIFLPLALFLVPAALYAVARPVWFLVALQAGYCLWNIWHFSAQNFGVLSAYRHRSGAGRPVERRLDKLYCVLIGLVFLPLACYFHFANLGALFEILPAPGEARGLGPVIVGGSLACAAAAVVLEWRRAARSWPRILFGIGMGLQPVVTVLFGPMYFLAVVMLNHWLVEIGFSAKVIGGSASRRLLGFVLAAGLLILISLQMKIWGFDGAVAVFSQEAMVWDPSGAHSPLLPQNVDWLGVFLLGIFFVHFLYDRYLYAFGDPATGEIVKPLLFQRSRA